MVSRHKQQQAVAQPLATPLARQEARASWWPERVARIAGGRGTGESIPVGRFHWQAPEKERNSNQFLECKSFRGVHTHSVWEVILRNYNFFFKVKLFFNEKISFLVHARGAFGVQTIFAIHKERSLKNASLRIGRFRDLFKSQWFFFIYKLNNLW